jgi:FixJ family two-component response regulator
VIRNKSRNISNLLIGLLALEGMEEPSPSSRTVLLVEDDVPFMQMLGRHLSGPWRLQMVESVAAALRAVEALPELHAVVTDLVLPDGSGLEVVTAVRARSQTTPVVVLTGHMLGPVINQIWALRAEYLVKVDCLPQIKLLRERLLDDHGNNHETARRQVAAFALQHHLTTRETEVLMLAVTDVPRSAIAGLLGISPDTLKTHVKSVLQKSEEKRFGELARKLRVAARPNGS